MGAATPPTRPVVCTKPGFTSWSGVGGASASCFTVIEAKSGVM